MNILYLCDEYPPGRHGGIGTAVQLLAREMVKQGHKVTVAGFYTPGYGGGDAFIDEGVKVYRFRWDIENKWFSAKASLSARIYWRVLKDTGILQKHIKASLSNYRDKLEEIIAAEYIDMIEMADYNDYMRFCRSYISFPALSKPIVVKMHGSFTYTHGNRIAGYIRQMEQAALRQATAVSAVSKYVAKKSAEYLGYDGGIKVLYNGIDTLLSPKKIKRNANQVIYTGKLVAGKGVFQLAKAWNIVNKTLPDARLLLLGTGDQQKVNAYLADKAKGSVTFMGHVPKDELYGHLCASAVAVFPSYSEAFALAPMEAMVCGAAVINSSRTSGPELIDDNVNGLLVDPGDVEQMASAILQLLNNGDERDRLANNGYEKVKRDFAIGKIAAANLVFYREVLGV